MLQPDNNFLKVQDPRQHSPFRNFVRATTGKKLYFNDDKTGPLPHSKI